MIACPTLERIEHFASSADGALDQPLATHLADCSSCRAMLDEVRANLGLAQVVRAVALAPTRRLDASGTVPEVGSGDAITRPAVVPPRAEPRPEIPGYTIVNELSRGGQGVVYLATQASTRREVAIKLLRLDRAGAGSHQARFEREVALLSSLRHPNIVTVFDSGQVGAATYLVMDYVPGFNLDEYVRLGSLSVERILRLMTEVADAVQAAHIRGVMHRDLKPGNIRVQPDGRPMVLDFGLAKDAAGDVTMTQTGQFLGSLPWASPEQVEGASAAVDLRTDVYALGVILHQLLTGDFPYPVDAPLAEVVRHIRETEPAPLRRAGQRLPRELDTLVRHCLHKEPQRRYQSAGELAADLRNYLAGRPLKARGDNVAYVTWKALARRKAAVLAAGLGVIAVVSVGAYWALNQRAQQLAHDLRQESASQIVSDYLNQLVYTSVKAVSPESIEPHVRQAAAAGVDPELRGMAWALALFGAERREEAATALREVLRSAPDRADALYLLALAETRVGERAYERAEFQAAEKLDDDSPAAWLFRGLALHTFRAEEAIEAYRKALDFAGQRDFPQARYHLGRAYNQLLYTRRESEVAEEAYQRLMLLKESPAWKAHPYYLLSINRKLAAEIMQEQGPFGDHDPVREKDRLECIDAWFREALRFAREGQEVDPADERPVTAEAQALESMGDLSAAIEVRTRAIAMAASKHALAEGLYYRWRLNYWVGDYDAALDDLTALAASGFGLSAQAVANVEVFYPALILADAGEVAAARERLAGFEPADTEAERWLAAFERLLAAGGSTEVRAAAEPSDAATAEPSPAKPSPADAFFAGLDRLARGEREQAAQHLRQAYLSFDGEMNYTYPARVLLVRLQQNPEWPAWLEHKRPRPEPEVKP